MSSDAPKPPEPTEALLVQGKMATRPKPTEKPQSRAAQARVDEAIGKLERQLGGRRRVLASLQVIELSEDEHQVMKLLADPRNDSLSLGKIARLAGPGMSAPRIIRLLGKAVGAKALVAANLEVYRGLPGVAKDVMQRSVPVEEDCWPCRGKGRIRIVKKDDEGKEQEDFLECDPCRGLGKIITYPDLERQKVALEMGGMLKSKGGVTINQQQVAIGGGLGVSAAFRDQTDQVLRQALGEAVEAEVVRAPEEPQS